MKMSRDWLSDPEFRERAEAIVEFFKQDGSEHRFEQLVRAIEREMNRVELQATNHKERR